jgi:malonate-semialdehyde dehydrogenase (acetylating)/methylmalonate-semialdehyde dehydrogenase
VSGYPGFFVGPTVLDSVRPEMAVVGEEVFGPVVSLVDFDRLDQAIDAINRGPYGNAASVYTSSGKTAREFRHRVRAGNVGINIGIASPMAYFPFGGMKDSFFGDLHPQGRDAIRFFTESKVVVTRWP